MENLDSNLYKNKISKLKTKVQNEYYFNVDNKKEIRKLDNKDLLKKVNTIFKNPNYIYKADVNIMYKNGDINSKRVVGIKDNYLLTLDGEKIYLDEIADIN